MAKSKSTSKGSRRDPVYEAIAAYQLADKNYTDTEESLAAAKREYFSGHDELKKFQRQLIRNTQEWYVARDRLEKTRATTLDGAVYKARQDWKHLSLSGTGVVMSAIEDIERLAERQRGGAA